MKFQYSTANNNFHSRFALISQKFSCFIGSYWSEVWHGKRMFLYREYWNLNRYYRPLSTFVRLF